MTVAASFRVVLLGVALLAQACSDVVVDSSGTGGSSAGTTSGEASGGTTPASSGDGGSAALALARFGRASSAGSSGAEAAGPAAWATAEVLQGAARAAVARAR